MTANKKRIYGLIGHPVKHSLSPAMHNAAFKALDIDGECEYRLFEVHPDDLDSFLDSLDKNNICGLNITIPYKEKILDFASLDSDIAFIIYNGTTTLFIPKIKKGLF